MKKVSIVMFVPALLGCLTLWQNIFSKSIAQTIKQESNISNIKLNDGNTLEDKQQTNLAIESPDKTAQQLPEDVQLSQAQINLLSASGLEVVMPTYVPPDFRLEYVQAKLDRYAGPGNAQYSIIFQKNDPSTAQRYCFAIEATSGGIGGLPMGLESYPINSPEFGDSTLEYGTYGESPHPTLLGNWLGTGPFYRFVGAGVDASLSRCENISTQEAIKISESLQYLGFAE